MTHARLLVVLGLVAAMSPAQALADASPPPDPAGATRWVVQCPIPGPAAKADAGVPAPTATIDPTAPGQFAWVSEDALPAKPIGELPGTWTAMPDAPIATRSGAATGMTLDGRMVVFSGYDAAGAGRDAPTAEATVRELPELPLIPGPDAASAPREMLIRVWGKGVEVVPIELPHLPPVFALIAATSPVSSASGGLRPGLRLVAGS